MAMQKDLRDKGVVVLGISVDTDLGDYNKFLKDHNVNFLTVRDPGQQNAKGVVAPVRRSMGPTNFPKLTSSTAMAWYDAKSLGR